MLSTGIHLRNCSGFFLRFDIYSITSCVLLFEKNGEELNSESVASEIIRARMSRPIESTLELANLISRVKKHRGKSHPATRIFQAIRIEVNDELNSLVKGVSNALDLLSDNGILAGRFLSVLIVDIFSNIISCVGR